MIRNDRVLGIIVLGIALLYGFEATQFTLPMAMHEAVGPSTFPLLLSICMAFCGVYFLIKPDADQSWPDLATFIEIFWVLFVLVAFAALITSAGFIIAACMMVGFVSLRMGASKKGALITGMSSAVSIYLLFNYLLELHLPAGILGL